MEKTKKNFSSSLKEELVEIHRKTKIGNDLLFFIYLNDHHYIKNNIFTIKLSNKTYIYDFIFEMLYKYEINFEVNKEPYKIIIKEYQKLEKELNTFLTKENLNYYFQNFLNLTFSSIFISKGYINSPESKYYHFEIRINKDLFKTIIFKSFSKINTFPKIKTQNKITCIYLKKSQEISDTLKFMGANNSVLYFEDIRIERDFLWFLQKINSIEVYNIEKIANSSFEQRQNIEFLINQKKFNNLNKNLKGIAILRLNNLDLSLSELAQKYNKENETNFSKSAINHWLREIKKIKESK